MTSQTKVAADIGGTFTDVVLDVDGSQVSTKVLTTHPDPADGVLEGVRQVLSRAQCAAADVGLFLHGTTLATNALIERRGARTALLTTEGHRDAVEMAFENRFEQYDIDIDRPVPLVPRHLRLGITERMAADGEVLIPLDEGSVTLAIESLQAQAVESIAIGFLHAYRNADHERRVAELVRGRLPGLSITLASEVCPEIREFERLSTACANAYVRPLMARYLESLQAQLDTEGLQCPFLLMTSGGGLTNLETAAKFPIRLVESGPAGGAILASHVAARCGFDQVLSFDMGGTTAKAGLIEHGTPRITKEYEVGTAARAERGAKGAGYPIRTPVIDLVEIGAGGGSIAWVDPGGMLRVGPQSAGADPAPVSYGQGGTEPTITDANLVLHRLDPDHFLGGEMHLDEEAAYRAIKEKCADPLGLDVVEVALGIVEIANTAMANALRRISVQRGHDPRDFVLVAFGGAGPVHANRLAVELDIPTVLVPMSPGTTSAMGLLVTDLKHDYSTTLIQRADRLDVEMVSRLYREMEDRGKKALLAEGMEHSSIGFERQVDMRYVGQSYELSIPLGDGKVEDALERMLQRFHEEHDRSYGFAASDEPVEIVTLRHTAVGSIAKPKLHELPERNGDVSAARRAVRQVFFAEAGGFVDCPSYDRYQLAAGGVIEGPAIVEEMDSTTVIQPGFLAEVDRYGNLLIRAKK